MLFIYVFFVALCSCSISAAESEWPMRDTGTGDKTVKWDHYSLMIDGQRVWIFGGEFHPIRLPVPEMWVDIFEKIKAIGMNTMSFINPWGFYSFDPNSVDFKSGAHNIEKIYQLGKDVGLFIQARPGPYVNGELNAGGFPLWVTTGEYGILRNADERYTGAWTPYLDRFADITAKYQISNNGTVLLYQLENEFNAQWSDPINKVPGDPSSIEHMKILYKHARDHGLVVPLVHNMPTPDGKGWSVDYDTVGAGGNVDIYGLDNYPACWSCVPEDCSSSNPSYNIMDYMSHFNLVSPKQPSMMPEFQGGATNPWDGPSEGCEAKTDEWFVNFYYRDNIGQRVTILILYMLYGGTNWGWWGAPFVTSSYGYSAAISENRTIGAKYNEIKSLGLFLRVATDLPKTDFVANSTGYATNKAINAIELKNPDTGARFYTLRHADPTSGSSETFNITLNTSSGNLTIPQHGGTIQLNGHIGKILVTDFTFGNKTLLYSTAEVLTYAIFDKKPTLVLWVWNDEDGEFLIEGSSKGKVLSGRTEDISFKGNANGLIVNFRRQKGTTVIQIEDGARVLILDRDSAHGFWAPPLTNHPIVPQDEVIFVQGPHLVRGAQLEGSLLSLRGDSSKVTDIEVYAPNQVKSLKWNGKVIQTTKTKWGSLKSKISGPKTFTPPKLSGWKFRDTLPERYLNYSDSGPAWADADHMETPNPNNQSTKPYLYADEYGFHTGMVLWRSRFNGAAKGMRVVSQGGVSHSWSLFLNGYFIKSFMGSLSNTRGDLEIEFPSDLLRDKNLILIAQDLNAHEQLRASIIPRGLVNTTLIGNEDGFTSWKVAGNAGGAENKQVDPIRTQYAEGGLTAERLGWHLPGFDDSDWESGSTADGLDSAGIRFYRASLTLDTPKGHDVSLSVKLTPGENTAFKGFIYVNGYQYGKFFPHFNPSFDTFPVPPGIWNYNGDNTVGLVLWNQANEAVTCDVELELNYIIASSLDVKFDSDYLRPGWTKERSRYI